MSGEDVEEQCKKFGESNEIHRVFKKVSVQDQDESPPTGHVKNLILIRLRKNNKTKIPYSKVLEEFDEPEAQNYIQNHEGSSPQPKKLFKKPPKQSLSDEEFQNIDESQ